MTLRLEGLCAFLLFAGACAPVRVVRPPPAPDRTLPALEAPLPEAGGGMARVVIWTDVPARVERVGTIDARGSRIFDTREFAARAVLCDPAPCVVTLPYGDYELTFSGIKDASRTGTATLRVHSDTVVFKHTLGQLRHGRGQVTGYAIVLTGLLLLGVSAAMATNPSARQNSSTVEGLAIAGAGGIALGGVVLVASPTTRQEGSTSQWDPFPRPPPIVGMSLGAKF
jgi:hypothetical protein